MKILFTILILLVDNNLVEATTLFWQDFGASTNPSWHRSTSGDSAFHDTWTVAFSLESAWGDQYARFDITTTATPSASTVRWWGGFSSYLGNFVTLPPVWELSFRIYLTTQEPIKISFLISDSERTFPSTDPPERQKELYFWVTPPGTGWQQVTVQSSEVVITETTLGSVRDMGTVLRISLSSHGPQGQPQSISQPGAYFMLLDDIEFIIPQHPFVSLHRRPDNKLSLFYSGTLQTSEDLSRWEDAEPQPTPHSLIDLNTPRQFFRAIDD